MNIKTEDFGGNTGSFVAGSFFFQTVMKSILSHRIMWNTGLVFG